MKYSEFNHDWSDMELQYLEGEFLSTAMAL